MVEKSLELLKADLREVLYLDLDEFVLGIEDGEVVSKFIGFKLLSAFQPIFSSVQGEPPIGHEALLRPFIGPDPVEPPFAFGFADSQGKLIKLDRVARTLHMLNHLQLPDSRGLLFLNVHPKLLVNVNTHGKVFERVLHSHSVPTSQVVIEVQESAVETDKLLLEAIGNYRDRNYKIAIDGFGGKHSSLDRLWRVSPDFIKLDMGIVHAAENNARVRRVLAKLVEIASELGAKAVVQGIETPAQLQIALDSGAPLLQGYQLGRPAPSAEWRVQAQPAGARVAA